MLRGRQSFHDRRGPPAQRSASRSCRSANITRLRCSLEAVRPRRTQLANTRVLSNQGTGFRQNAWHWRGLRKVGFLRAAESHAPSTGFALKSNSMQGARSPVKHPTSCQVRCQRPVASSTVGGRCKEAVASENERPNHSIERTHNGGAQCLAPSRVVPPLCAAHVKR